MREGSTLMSPLGDLALAPGLGELDLLKACAVCQSAGARLVVRVVAQPLAVAPPAAPLVLRWGNVG